MNKFAVSAALWNTTTVCIQGEEGWACLRSLPTLKCFFPMSTVRCQLFVCVCIQKIYIFFLVVCIYRHNDNIYWMGAKYQDGYLITRFRGWNVEDNWQTLQEVSTPNSTHPWSLCDQLLLSYPKRHQVITSANLSSLPFNPHQWFSDYIYHFHWFSHCGAVHSVCKKLLDVRVRK